MIRSFSALAAVLGSLLCAQIAVAGCDGASDPCHLPAGTYHIVLPDGTDGPHPAVLLLHGYGGDGAGFVRKDGLARLFLARGYAVIAPNGQPRRNGKGRSWDFHPDRPATRDETAFLMAVADDAARKHGVKRDQMLLAGFSIGGSMTSYVACRTPAAFAAYAPVAGSFWRPHPAACAGPVNLLHTHGTADRTVPMKGRTIAPGFEQGNVLQAVQIWRTTDGCRSAVADRLDTNGRFSIRQWTDCLSGKTLTLALHTGGHSIPQGWAQMTLDWYEALD